MKKCTCATASSEGGGEWQRSDTCDGGWHGSHDHAARLSPHIHIPTTHPCRRVPPHAQRERASTRPSISRNFSPLSVDWTGEPYAPTTTHTCLLVCVCTHMCVAGWLRRTGRDGMGRMLRTSFSVRTSVHTCSEGMAQHTGRPGVSHIQIQTHTRMQTYLRPYGRQQGSE